MKVLKKRAFIPIFLAIAILLGIFLSKFILVPPSFGKYAEDIAYEWYRGDAVVEEASKYVKHLSPNSCKKCHKDQVKAWSEGLHKSFFCGDCHGIGAGHPEVVKELPINDKPKDCLRCHAFLLGRPESFPQINPQDHFGFDMKTMKCIDCHDPHNPGG